MPLSFPKAKTPSPFEEIPAVVYVPNSEKVISVVVMFSPINQPPLGEFIGKLTIDLPLYSINEISPFEVDSFLSISMQEDSHSILMMFWLVARYTLFAFFIGIAGELPSSEISNPSRYIFEPPSVCK